MNVEANITTTTLQTYRGVALITGLVALLISPMLESYVENMVDPWVLRYLLGGVSLAFFAVSFYSSWVVANMQRLMVPFAYGAGAWLLYLTYLNDFVPAIAYSVFEILVGGSIVFVTLRSLGLYLCLICGTTLTLLQFAGAPALHKEMYVSTLVIVALLIFLFSYLRHDLQKELRASAKLMQSVFNNSADALLLLRGGEIISSSKRSLEMFNIVDAAGLAELLRDPIKERERFLDCSDDIRLTTNENRNVWVEVVVSAVDGSRLELMRLTDISERKQAELELTQAVAAAEQALSVRRDFLTNVSHELRTPLNGVIGTARLLAVDFKDSGALDLIHLIERSGSRLLASIDNIIAYAELDSGQLEIRAERLDLDDCVERALKSVREQAQHKDLQLQLDNSVTQSLRVGDAECINQVLELLLQNAVKFTKTGYVKLQVTTPVGESTEFVEFAVIDSGIGIDPGMLQDIFDSFKQVDASDSRHHEGVGLGLAICSRLAIRLDAQLHCSSELGQGTCFRFTLELPKLPELHDVASLTSDTAATESSAERLPVSSQPVKPRVLLVEDNEINQKITLLMLDKLGYDADLAGDGLQAIDACKERAYDLILMDLQMPNMGGLEATQNLRNQRSTQTTPIIALTANARSTDRERCLAAGMNDFLTKPAKLDALGDRLQRHLHAL